MTNRFRMWVPLSVLSLSACTSPSGQTPELPKSISPGWQLASFARVGDGWQGAYTGPGTAHVRIDPIASQAVGLDRIQHFRASATSVAFYGDHYFAIVTWDGVGGEQASSLVKALEDALK